MENLDIISSKLTSKYQATIPASVRTVLELEASDEIIFDIADGKVILSKKPNIEPEPADEGDANLGEWSSAEDDELFGGL